MPETNNAESVSTCSSNVCNRLWIQSVDNTLCFEQSEAVADEAKTSDPVGELLLSALIEAHVIRFVRALPTLGVTRLIALTTCLRRIGPGRCTTSDLRCP
jgi:hypothetical protein